MLKSTILRQIYKTGALHITKKQFVKWFGQEYNQDYIYETKLGIRIYAH